MARISRVVARLKGEPIADLPIAEYVNQELQKLGVEWRERLLPPLATLRLFLIQILNGNCAIAALRQLGGVDFAPSSYCEARGRLPLILLQSLLQWVREQAEEHVAATARVAGRIFVADGSTYSMADTPELAAHFDLPPGTRAGVGYPAGKLMGLLDLATGMFTSLLALPLFEHDARSVIGVHEMLCAGDILLGDRAVCSFAHVALLAGRGVFACLRLHQRRKNMTRGVQRWDKPAEPPAWMDARQYALLPEFIEVRIVKYTVAHKGFRTRTVLVATTLMNTTIWPDSKIAQLYGQRWTIETCFDHLKTTMNMNVLRCKTVEGVMKELAMYLTAYNLVRLAMLQAAARQHTNVWRISFVDAMRCLAARLIGLAGILRLIVNPKRPGRHQLRTIRRRPKEYDLLVRPRRQAEAQAARNQAVKN